MIDFADSIRDIVLEISKFTNPGFIKAFKGVGHEWEMGEHREFRGMRYIMGSDGFPEYSKPCVWGRVDIDTIAEMLSCPEELKPVHVWSAEAVDDAKAALRLGAFQVRNNAGIMQVDICGEWVDVNGGLFRPVVPGQCIALSEIVGGA